MNRDTNCLFRDGNVRFRTVEHDHPVTDSVTLVGVSLWVDITLLSLSLVLTECVCCVVKVGHILRCVILCNLCDLSLGCSC